MDTWFVLISYVVTPPMQPFVLFVKLTPQAVGCQYRGSSTRRAILRKSSTFLHIFTFRVSNSLPIYLLTTWPALRK